MTSLRIAVAALSVAVTVAHFWVGLPAMQQAFFSVPFTFLALASAAWALALRQTWAGLALGGAILLTAITAPVAGTIAIGTLRYGNLKSSGPDEHDAGDSLEIGKAAERPLFVHLSDSHFVGASRRTTLQNLPRDPVVLGALSKRIRTLKPTYLFVTGDVTDSGSEPEWQQAEEILLGPARQDGIVVIVAPGNHDLQPAFGGVDMALSPERASTILLRRFLEASGIARTGLRTTDGRSVASLVDWRPTEAEVADRASRDYLTCVANPIEPRAAGPAWAHGCALATTPERTRESIVTFHTAAACTDWFPLLHIDATAGVAIFVLCSSAVTTSTYGSNAIGAFGAPQIQRLLNAIQELPSTARHVLILLHHPPVKRWGDDNVWPRNWLSWTDWNNSSMYNFALLGSEWRGTVELMNGLVNARQRPESPAIAVLFGHRHGRSLARVGTPKWAIPMVEADVFGEPAGSEPAGIRAAYLSADGSAIEFRWLTFPVAP